MKFAKFHITLVLALFTLTSIAQKKQPVKNLNQKLIGHWVAQSTKDSVLTIEELIDKRYTITYKAIEYKEDLYHWGGGAYNGIAFNTNKTFTTYSWVGCSEGTNPQTSHDETWKIVGDRINIYGEYVDYDIQIISIKKDKLKVRYVPNKN